MKVLFVLSRYPGYGGIENVSTILCNSFSAVLPWVGIYSFAQQDEDQLLIELEKKVHYVKSAEANVFHSKKNISQLAELIRAEKIDIIVYQDSYAPYFKTVTDALKGQKTKLVVVEHNTPEQSLKTSPLSEVLRKNIKHNRLRSILAYYKGRWCTRSNYIFKYIRCDRYVLLSEAYKPYFRKLVPFASQAKLMVITNPAPENYEELDYEKENQCLFCGRLESAKGVDYLMKIWTILEGQRKDWHLIIVGDGSHRQNVLDYIEKHQLTNVHLTGFKKETGQYYCQSKIFLMPSRFEGWGVSVFEAKAHGCVPVMFNSFAAAPEVIDNDVDGYLLSPFDIENFAQRVLTLMDDTEKRHAMSLNAKESIKKYSLKNIQSKWISLFESLNNDKLIM